MMNILTYIDALKKSEGVRHSVIMIVGNMFATGISAAALILISRALGPVKFGEFSVGFSALLVLIRLNDVGLNATLQKFIPPASNEERNNIMNFSITAKLVLTAVTIIVSLILTPWLTLQLHLSSPMVLYIAIFGSIVVAAYEHLIAFFQALHQFTRAVILNAIQSSMKLVGAIVLWVASIKGTGITFSWYAFAPIIAVVYGIVVLPKWVHIHLSRNYSRELRLLGSMAFHSAVGYIAAGLIENVDVFFVQHHLSTFDTGLYAGISRIAMVPLLVGYSLGNVLNPRVARYSKTVDLDVYLKKSFMLSGLCVLGVVAAVPFTRYLILYTIGPDYLGGTGLLTILIAASFLTIAAIPFQALFFSFKAEWYFSISGIFQLLIIVVGNGLLLDTYGLAGAVWTRVASRAFLLIFSMSLGMWWYRKHYRNAPEIAAG